MSIVSKASNKQYLDNFDDTFRKSTKTEKAIQYWECWRDEEKRTARFTSLKEAQTYAKKYPRDVEYGIKCPDGTWLKLEEG